MALRDAFEQAEQRVRAQNNAAADQAHLLQTTLETLESNLRYAYDATAEALYQAICDQAAEQLVANQGRRVTVTGHISDFNRIVERTGEVFSRAEYRNVCAALSKPTDFFEKFCKKHHLYYQRNITDHIVIHLEHRTTVYTGGYNIFGSYHHYRLFLSRHGKEVLRRMNALAQQDGVSITPIVLETRQKVDKNDCLRILWTKQRYKHLGFKLKEPILSSTHATHMLAFQYTHTGKYNGRQHTHPNKSEV